MIYSEKVFHFILKLQGDLLLYGLKRDTTFSNLISARKIVNLNIRMLETIARKKTQLCNVPHDVSLLSFR